MITCNFPSCGPVVQLVASPIASPIAYPRDFDTGRPHTYVEIDHEIFSTVILLLMIQEGQLSITKESMFTEYWLTI